MTTDSVDLQLEVIHHARQLIRAMAADGMPDAGNAYIALEKALRQLDRHTEKPACPWNPPAA